MKKITFFINNLGVGGAERVFVDDVNELYRQGYEVSIVLLYGDATKSPLIKELALPSDRIYFLKAKNLFDYSVYKAFYDLLVRTGTSVLYATLHDATFVSRLVALCIPTLRLVTREANTTEFKSFLHKCADVCMNWRVHTMIAVSEEVKQSMLSYQSWYAHKVTLLYNGVSFPSVAGVGDPARILAVGSLTPKKNYSMLVDAFEIAHRSYPQATLYIIGDGVQKTLLEVRVKEKTLQEHVVFLGKKNHEDVLAEYRTAGIFVLSSDQEGCPNVLLEAMSFGVPAVATAVGAVPEIIEHAVSGLIVPRRETVLYAEQIKLLCGSEDMRKRIGLAGRERVKTMFSNEVHMSRLKDILHI